MFCTLRQKYGKMTCREGTWNISPCTRLRLESITRHKKSSSHFDSVRSERNRSLPEAINPPSRLSDIEKVFSCLYFLCKRKIAHTTNNEPLLDFIQYLGLKVKENVGVAKNALCTSDQVVQEIVHILSEVIENEIIEKMRTADNYALLFDKRTDCTLSELMAIHGRFYDKKLEKVVLHFVKVVDVLQPEVDNIIQSQGCGEQSRLLAGSAVITKRIEEFMRETMLDEKTLVGIRTDGASTMIGCQTGVVQRLKQKSPAAVGIHCAAHRLNLASTQAGASVAYVQKFNSVLRQLLDFVDNSTVRSAGLIAVQKLLQEKGKLVAPSTTKWLSVERCANKLKSCFSFIVLSLDREAKERSNAKPIGLSALVCDINFVPTLLLSLLTRHQKKNFLMKLSKSRFSLNLLRT